MRLYRRAKQKAIAITLPVVLAGSTKFALAFEFSQFQRAVRTPRASAAVPPEELLLFNNHEVPGLQGEPL